LYELNKKNKKLEDEKNQERKNSEENDKALKVMLNYLNEFEER
jgi:hypothetical protein